MQLWLHECSRTFSDRLSSPEDVKKFAAIATDVCKKTFSKFNLHRFTQAKNPEPLVFASFASEGEGGEVSRGFASAGDRR